MYPACCPPPALADSEQIAINATATVAASRRPVHYCYNLLLLKSAGNRTMDPGSRPVVPASSAFRWSHTLCPSRPIMHLPSVTADVVASPLPRLIYICICALGRAPSALCWPESIFLPYFFMSHLESVIPTVPDGSDITHPATKCYGRVLHSSIDGKNVADGKL